MWKPSALMLAIVVLSWSALPAAAQCNPSFDPDCYGSGNGLGPDVAISPDGGSYLIDSGTKAVPITIVFSDADGLDPASVQVRLTNGSSTTAVNGLTWKANTSGTGGTLSGTLTLATAGDNVLSAQMADRAGSVGAGQAVFYLGIAGTSGNPVVSYDAYHPDYRNTNSGAAVMAYSLPPYTSQDVGRTLGLYYNSEQATPTVFLSVDARPPAHVASQTVAVSLYRTTPGPSWTPVGREYFFKKAASGSQRLAAEWSMKDSPSGAYEFPIFVRIFSPWGWNQAGGYMRALVLNEKDSRYGAGWALAGVQRMVVKSAGILISEGSGILRYFVKQGCTATTCTWLTPEGDFTSLTYDHPSLQYIRTYIDGSKVTFSIAGLMTSHSDPFGRTTTYTWQNSPDAAQVPVLQKVTDPAGKVTLLEYYPTRYLRQITDPAGRTAVFTYTGKQLTNITGPQSLAASYDSAGRVTSYTIDGATWDFTYDTRGAGWDVTTARPTVATVTAPPITPNGPRPVTTVTSLQAATVLADDKGKELGTYDGSTYPLAAAAQPSDDRFVKNRDPLGHTTSMSVDRYGNPVKVVDHVQRVWLATWGTDGLPLSSSEPTNRFTSWSWNARGQLLRQEVNGAAVYEASYKTGTQPEFEASGGSGRWMSYGSRGELIRSWYGEKTDEQRTATTYEYDSAYRLVRTIGPKGERTEWVYGDAVWGNVSGVRVFRADGSIGSTDMTFDQAGRARTVTAPDGYSVTIDYDALNRPKSSVDQLNRTVAYAYTGLYLTSVTDPTGKVYQFAYDPVGRLLRETYPDGLQRTYAYNQDGMQASITDRRSTAATPYTTTLTWDGAHRLSSRSADDGVTTFGYPDNFTRVITNAEGTETVRITPSLGTIGSVTTTYAGLPGRRFEIQRVPDPEAGWRQKGLDVRAYQNDALLRTDSIRMTPTYRPLDLNYRSELSVQDLSGRTTTLYYDTAGRHVRTNYPNGIVQSHGYTSDGRLESTLYTNHTVNGTFGATFEYDIVNRLTTRTSANVDSLTTFGYDPLGQLTSHERSTRGTPPGCNPSLQTCEPTWLPATTASYSYDAAANRTDSASTIMANSNRYARFNGFQLTYDAEGNLTRKYKTGFDQTFSWNKVGQLVSVTTNGSTVTYGYGGSGERVRRTEAGQSRYFLYEGGDLLMELDYAGNPFRSYTHLPGIDRPLSLRVTSGTTESTYYYVTEQPGHVMGLMNLSGGLNAIYRYSPWGAAEYITGAVSSQPLRFMSRELDANGLYYVRNRWYDPALARFISEDPIGLSGGVNTYAYAMNDPVNRTDPSGLSPCERGSHWEDGVGCVRDGVVLLDPVNVIWRGLGGKLTAFFYPDDPHDTGDRPLRQPAANPCYRADFADPEDICRGTTPYIPRSPARDRELRLAAREACRAARRESSLTDDGNRNTLWNAITAGGGWLVGKAITLGSVTPTGRAIRAGVTVLGWFVGGYTEAIGDRILKPCEVF